MITTMLTDEAEYDFPGVLWAMHGAAALNAIAVAGLYRAGMPGCGEWVFVHEGEAFEDGEELGAVGIWGPGVMAVSAEGAVLRATGGDAQVGARVWQQVNASAWKGGPWNL